MQKTVQFPPGNPDSDILEVSACVNDNYAQRQSTEQHDNSIKNNPDKPHHTHTGIKSWWHQPPSYLLLHPIGPNSLLIRPSFYGNFL